MRNKTQRATALLLFGLPLLGLISSFFVAYVWIPLDSMVAAFPVISILLVSNFLTLWLAGRRPRNNGHLDALSTPSAPHDQDSLTRRHQDLGVLAAGIAHELGQPLSAARVDIEGLHLLRQLGREPDSEQTQRILSRVGTCILTMTQIIGHLRELAQSQPSATAQPLAVDEIVRAVLGERSRWDITGEIVIEWIPPREPLMARGDALGLRLILVNILRNACESISLPDPTTPQIRISLGPGSRMDIQDFGPGMAPERLATIFEPYGSSKNGHHGVGLSLARISAERMGAQISVSSTPGIGSVFTIRLASV